MNHIQKHIFYVGLLCNVILFCQMSDSVKLVHLNIHLNCQNNCKDQQEYKKEEDIVGPS